MILETRFYGMGTQVYPTLSVYGAKRDTLISGSGVLSTISLHLPGRIVHM
jgi:hypothetical protein